MVFMQFLYWSKFTSVWKKNSEKYRLDKIWEHKNTRDIVHYLKFEHDLFCLIGSDIILHIRTLILFRDSFTGFMEYVHYLLIIGFKMIMLMATYRHLTTQNDCFHGIPWTIFWPSVLGVLVFCYIWFCIDFRNQY